jgi:hypothetical protein
VNSSDLGAPAFAWVTVLGGISGAISLLVFRRWTDRERVRRAAIQIVAHLLEIRLFSEEPRFVMRAQLDLIIANGRLLRETAKPLLLMLLPLSALVAGMNLFFGYVPLRLGENALVTPTQARLESPHGIRVDGEPVYIPTDRQLVWQVHADIVTKGELQVSSGDITVKKKITTERGIAFVSSERAGSVWQFLLHPGECPFSNDAIESISIQYRAAKIFRVYWLWWYCLSSVVSAGVFARIDGH